MYTYLILVCLLIPFCNFPISEKKMIQLYLFIHCYFKKYVIFNNFPNYISRHLHTHTCKIASIVLIICILCILSK